MDEKKYRLPTKIVITIERDDEDVETHTLGSARALKKMTQDNGVVGKLIREEIDLI